MCNRRGAWKDQLEGGELGQPRVHQHARNDLNTKGKHFRIG